MSASCKSSIAWLEICCDLVGIDEAELEAFAGASMAWLCHKARHKIGKCWLNGIPSAVRVFADRTA